MRAAMFRKKIISFFYEHPVATLLIFFFISVAVRMPNLNRPLSKHHELNAALVLINAEEWNRKSPSFYHYVPVHSYHQPGDDIYPEADSLAQGYLVNVSFGSLWYIMPYEFFHLLHSPPSPLLLQVFNLLLHLVTILLIYKIALYLFEPASDARIKSIVTCIIYLFSPAPLWFHGNGYVHEIAVLPFVYGSVLLYLYNLNKPTLVKQIAMAVLIIGGVCCDWLACFIAAAMFIHSLYFYVKGRNITHLSTAFFISVAVVTGIAITVLQFSSFMGFNDYFQALVSRFLLRGIKGESEGGGLAKGAGIATFYLIGYGLLTLLILFAFAFSKQCRKDLQANRKLRGFLLIASLVCLFHHFLFWGFTNIHDYSVVKSGLVISLLTSIAVFSYQGSSKKIAVLIAILIVNTGIYYYINRPGKFAANGQPYTYFQNLGEHIKAIATPNDYIFIDTPEFSLLLTYYSKRYYRTVKDVKDAESLFKALPGKNALFIHTDNFQFVGYTRLSK
jgi:hypothetical protein